ncbi:MAG: guanylate kinase [Clostridium sp.]|nr:guanylate kinase [Clostridium sp.]MDY3827389.1 guanylate kinase [Clostridium sp.]
MKKKGILLVISGPTGAGKDKVIKSFLEKHPETYMQKSVTTRTMREDEVQGEEYDFVTNVEFFKVVDKGGFLEWSEVYGNYYGTPKHQVNKILKSGGNVLLEVDIKGALQIKENYSDAVLIFILPTSMEVLKKNILESKKDSPENLLRRFNSAFNEIQSISTYNYGIVNDDVDKVVEKIENIMSAEECRVDRVKEIYDFKYV